MNAKDIVRDFISSELLQGIGERDLSDDEPLIESGVVDSLGIMTLLSFLEDRLSLQVSGEDLVPENFASISAIATLVERRANERGSHGFLP